ncbi:hypothetical protein GW17_00059408 [Ensete ventricosum]|nr:hypothetical protein GW17_00059408 [Ensete ventricosum]RZS26426.1 hypothetical protein BHM03_00059766 [Ensete ventricosum]
MTHKRPVGNDGVRARTTRGKEVLFFSPLLFLSSSSSSLFLPQSVVDGRNRPSTVDFLLYRLVAGSPRISNLADGDS